MPWPSVTISTRVRRHAQVLAIAERFPNVTCSVGTHPHNADEEDGIAAEELIGLTRHPKVVALGEAGLDYFYQHGSREAQERGFRAHIAAARATPGPSPTVSPKPPPPADWPPADRPVG